MKFPAIAQLDRRDFESAWSECWQVRVKRAPSVWAVESYRLPISSPVSTGDASEAFSYELFPHCVEPADCADDPNIRKIVLWFAIREGKTLGICMPILGRMVTDAPGNGYSVHPTDDDVARFSEGDLEPMIGACLESYFVERKSRIAGRTVNFKAYRGGWIRIVNAGSLTKFSGTSVKVLLLHELDRLNREAIYKAFGRTTGYKDAIIVEESSGTNAPIVKENGDLEYRSNIHASYDEGDQRKWFCTCRECGCLRWLKYEQIREVETPQGTRHRYFCEACDYAHTPAEWRKMAAGGLWFPTAGLSEDQQRDIRANWRKAKPKKRNVASFWRNGCASLLPPAKGYRDKLHEFYEQEKDSNITPEARKIWVQEHRAELWSPILEGEPPPPWRPLFDRRETYNDGKGGLVVPSRCLIITGGIDVQINRLELVWMGTGRGNETWSLDYVILHGDPQENEVWDALDKELDRQFTREDGATMAATMAFIDTAKWPDRVWKFLTRKPRSNIRACRGSPKRPHPIVASLFQPLASSKMRIATMEKTVVVRGHWIGGDSATEWIYSRLIKEPEGAELPDGWHHFGMHCDENYFGQLTSEKVFIEDDGERRYEHVGPCRNEVHDCHKYALGAFRFRSERRWDFDAIERNLAEQAKAKNESQNNSGIISPAKATAPKPAALVSRHAALVSRLNPWG